MFIKVYRGYIQLILTMDRLCSLTYNALHGGNPAANTIDRHMRICSSHYEVVHVRNENCTYSGIAELRFFHPYGVALKGKNCSHRGENSYL